MTKAEACRKIADKLEPEPTQWAGRLLDGPHYRFWHKQYSTANGNEWIPVNFFESEAASARLLEAMTEVGLHRNKEDGSWSAGEVWNHCGWAANHIADRKTAIVLAAMKWLNIEGELGA